MKILRLSISLQMPACAVFGMVLKPLSRKHIQTRIRNWRKTSSVDLMVKLIRFIELSVVRKTCA